MVTIPKKRLSSRLLKISLSIAIGTVFFFGLAIFAVEFQAGVKEEQHRLSEELDQAGGAFTRQVQRYSGRIRLLTENPKALLAAIQSLKTVKNPEIFFGPGVLHYQILYQTHLESGGQPLFDLPSLLRGPRREIMKIVPLRDNPQEAGILAEAHAIDGGDVLSIRVLWSISSAAPWKDWTTNGPFQSLALTNEQGAVIWTAGIWPEVQYGAESSTVPFREIVFNGEEYVEVSKEISVFSEPMTLRALAPKKYLYSKSWKMSRGVLFRTLTILAVGMGFVCMLAYWVRHVMKPLDDISRGVQRVAEGNLETVLKSDGDDEISFLADTLNDMTHRLKVKEQSVQAHIQLLKEKNDELQRLSERLKEADRLKDHFLAVLSHELRTPLTAILGYSDVLLEGIYGPLSQKQTEGISSIKSSGNKLLSIMEDLLDLAKIRAGTIEVNPEPFDPAALLADIRSYAEQSLRQKPAVRFLEEIEPNLPRFNTDQVKLEQIITNLLSNAMKFTDTGSIRLSVARDGKHHVRFSVEDTGIGIAPQHLPKIFDPFVQLDAGIRRKYGGTGLGLTISKTLVEKLGGQIHVNSELGRGTRFAFVIPIDFAQPPSPAQPPQGLPGAAA